MSKITKVKKRLLSNKNITVHGPHKVINITLII